MQQKFYSIDVIRGAATCLVAFAHATWRVAEPRFYGAKPFNGVFDGLFVSVDFFFVLSGFLIAWVHWNDIGRHDRIMNYFKRRLSRIYPIYWVVLTLLIIGHVFHPAVTHPDPMSFKIVLTSYAIIPNDGPTILGVAWTLYYEIACYIAFGLLLYVGNRGFILISIWATAIVVYNLSDIPKIFPYSFYLHPYHLQFLSGIATAALVRRFTIPFPKLMAFFGCAAFLGIVLLQPIDIFDYSQLALRSLFGILACIIIAGLVEAERSGGLKVPLWLQNFGAGSYSIYLVHTIVQPPFLQYTWRVLSHVPAEIAAVLCAAFSIAVGYAFHRAVELPLTERVKDLIMSKPHGSRQPLEVRKPRAS